MSGVTKFWLHVDIRDIPKSNIQFVWFWDLPDHTNAHAAGKLVAIVSHPIRPFATRNARCDEIGADWIKLFPCRFCNSIRFFESKVPAQSCQFIRVCLSCKSIVHSVSEQPFSDRVPDCSVLDLWGLAVMHKQGTTTPVSGCNSFSNPSAAALTNPPHWDVMRRASQSVLTLDGQLFNLLNLIPVNRGNPNLLVF
jgi:hypothetical protein